MRLDLVGRSLDNLQRVLGVGVIRRFARFVLDPFLDGRDKDDKFAAFVEGSARGFLMFASEYSNKNADEAFAEYTVDEHPMADLMRTMFEYVAGLR